MLAECLPFGNHHGSQVYRSSQLPCPRPPAGFHRSYPEVLGGVHTTQEQSLTFPLPPARSLGRQDQVSFASGSSWLRMGLGQAVAKPCVLQVLSSDPTCLLCSTSHPCDYSPGGSHLYYRSELCVGPWGNRVPFQCALLLSPGFCIRVRAQPIMSNPHGSFPFLARVLIWDDWDPSLAAWAGLQLLP